jgi:hypothetical protein
MSAMADSGHHGAGDEDPLLREFNEVLATQARFTEPSAAERARKPGWRARRRLARSARRAARAPHLGRGHAVVTTLLTGLVLLVLAGVWIVIPRLIHHGAAGTPVPPSVRPTVLAAPPLAGLPADPFAGSPADGFAAGAAGLVPPAPHAVGGYSRAQVRRAYLTVQRLLTAADLNQATLLGGSPRAFARLLTRQQRRIFTRHLARTGLTSRGASRSTRAWVASFAPGSVQFAGNVIKVHGTMRATAATTSPGPVHVLRVTVDYLFVYAVERPGMPSTRTRVILRDTRYIDFGHWDSLSGPLQPWWDVHPSVAGVQCASTDGYLHTDFRQAPDGRARPTGAPVDPYNQSAPPPPGCRTVTRT